MEATRRNAEPVPPTYALPEMFLWRVGTRHGRMVGMTTGAVVRKKRSVWSQAEVARLLTAHVEGREEWVAVGRPAAECRAKLIELGLVQREPKPVLAEGHRRSLDEMAYKLGALAEPQRTLAVRYAVSSLRALLPKRERRTKP